MKTITLKLVYFQDAGHGWLRVTKTLLNEFNLLDKISPYSYQKGNNVYLEEDSDAGILLSNFKKTGYQNGIESFKSSDGKYILQVTSKHSDRSSIRNYYPYEFSDKIA